MFKKAIAKFKLLKLFQTESGGFGRKSYIMAMVAGLSNAAVIVFINTSVTSNEAGSLDLKYLLLILLAIFLYTYSRQYVMLKGLSTAEEVVKNLRLRLADKVRKINLRTLEEVTLPDIYTKISKETSLISQSSSHILNALESVIVVFFALIYIAFLSPVILLFCLFMILGSSFIYLRSRKKAEKDLLQSKSKEVELFSSLTDILYGFKEIKINRQRSKETYKKFKKISGESEDLRVKALIQYAKNFLFSKVFFYVLVAALVFIVPLFSSQVNSVEVEMVSTILFLMGPLSVVIGVIPLLSQINVQIDSIMDLEKKLDNCIEQNGNKIIHTTTLPFKEITCEDLVFTYGRSGKEKDSFSVGPVNLKINKGEVIFIIGGNGCGKSTLLKLLTALYNPCSGAIKMDGNTIDQSNIQTYREFFSIIFTDFHLFRKIYGIKNLDKKKITDLLELMMLDDKTEYKNKKFTTTDLSTGQRKRLAFIVTYLEDRDIYLFDELAADQDPQFRKYFYEVIVRDFKKKGKTVIAVSHDDRYFHVADRVIKMEYGNIVNEETNE